MSNPGSFSFQTEVSPDFQVDYIFTYSPDAEDQLHQALDLILELILEDIQKEIANNGGDQC